MTTRTVSVKLNTVNKECTAVKRLKTRQSGGEGVLMTRSWKAGVWSREEAPVGGKGMSSVDGGGASFFSSSLGLRGLSSRLVFHIWANRSLILMPSCTSGVIILDPSQVWIAKPDRSAIPPLLLFEFADGDAKYFHLRLFRTAADLGRRARRRPLPTILRCQMSEDYHKSAYMCFHPWDLQQTLVDLKLRLLRFTFSCPRDALRYKEILPDSWSLCTTETCVHSVIKD